jgi:hypothetical protein
MSNAVWEREISVPSHAPTCEVTVMSGNKLHDNDMPIGGAQQRKLDRCPAPAKRLTAGLRTQPPYAPSPTNFGHSLVAITDEHIGFT